MSSDVIDDKVAEKPLGKPEKFDDDTTLIDGLLDGKYPDKEDEVEPNEEGETDEKEPEDGSPEIEEPEEQEEIKVESNRGIDVNKIKEKYPDFAKTPEYRELRNAYYREAKYTELFPTIEDAQEAAENNEMFNKMNSDILGNGDVTNLLAAIKDSSPQQLRKVGTTFMDTLSKVDAATWQEAMGGMIKRMARDLDTAGRKYLARNAQSDDGKALVATARNILLHYFDDDKVDLSERPAQPQVNEKEKELEAREQQIAQQQYTSAYRSVESATMKRLDEMITDGLDPNQSLSDFTRKALLKEIKQEIMDQASADTSHVRKMSSLWERAARNGYDRESLSRIAAAYLERVRPIIPTVRNKFRSMAIKGNARNDREDSPKIPRTGRSGRPASNDGKVNMRSADPKKIDYRHTSDNDIFEGKVKLKEK